VKRTPTTRHGESVEPPAVKIVEKWVNADYPARSGLKAAARGLDLAFVRAIAPADEAVVVVGAFALMVFVHSVSDRLVASGRSAVVPTTMPATLWKDYQFVEMLNAVVDRRM
jgi:hypothetical protein